jgi:Ca2+-binding EF-hand superfamily protein
VKLEWDRADKDKSGSLSFKEIMRLLGKLNLKMKEKEAKKRFRAILLYIF